MCMILRKPFNSKVRKERNDIENFLGSSKTTKIAYSPSDFNEQEFFCGKNRFFQQLIAHIKCY